MHRGAAGRQRVLRITYINESKSPTLKLEGKLAGPWVGEVEKTWRSIQQPLEGQALAVDLNEVSFIDRSGEKLLKQMHASGVVLFAEGLYIRGRLRRITGHKRLLE